MPRMLLYGIRPNLQELKLLHFLQMQFTEAGFQVWVEVESQCDAYPNLTSFLLEYFVGSGRRSRRPVFIVVFMGIDALNSPTASPMFSFETKQYETYYSTLNIFKALISITKLTAPPPPPPPPPKESLVSDSAAQNRINWAPSFPIRFVEMHHYLFLDSVGITVEPEENMKSRDLHNFLKTNLGKEYFIDINVPQHPTCSFVSLSTLLTSSIKFEYVSTSTH